MSAGLYIHIPFCIRKCKYCDFVSFCDMHKARPYMRALEKEIELRAQTPAFQTYFDTVFFGGGTPSALPAEEIAACLAKLRAAFPIAPDAEISMEANPGTLSAEKLNICKEAGMNRLSLGLQSADDALLARIGRIHRYEDFLSSYEAALSSGFSNINVDIMYGLPMQSAAAHADTLEKLCALHPAHISAYALILEEGTPLYNEGPELPDEDECYEMHLHTRNYLAKQGYERYEISNYARAGRMCRHNLHYWNAEEYLGLGLNAHSAWRLDGVWTRFANTAVLADYSESLERGALAEADRQSIAKPEEMFEFVMLGLRKTEGIEEGAFEKRFQITLDEVYKAAIAKLAARGWIIRKDGYFRLNERGLDMQNEALLFLMD